MRGFQVAMHGYNFTEDVRKALAQAREEAGRLRHEYVGTEHILLGLLVTGEGGAAAVLRELAIEVSEIQRSIEEAVPPGRGARPAGQDLPYTSRAKKVIELAMREAEELEHDAVGTEHLLIGLLREERGIAAQVLHALGATLQVVRRESIRRLGAPTARRREQVASAEAGRALRPIRFTLQVDCEGGAWFEERFERAADAIAYLRALAPDDPGRGDAPPTEAAV